MSFIVPTYNEQPELLAACLDSICALSLSRAEREIVVVDDGSAASPLPALGRWIDDIVYVRQPNAGLSGARNTGLRMARGVYVQFVDADDELLSAPYEHCLDMARYQRHDVVMFDFTRQRTTAVTYDDTAPTSGADYMRSHNLRGTAWGYLFRRAILGELRFKPGIYHEDEDFTPRLLLRAETVVATTAQAYLYRQRPGTITSRTDTRSTLKRLSDLKGVVAGLHNLADTLPTPERTALQRRVAQLTMDYIYKIIVETGHRTYLDHRIGELRRMGLFPLPDHDYTAKYTWFRRLTESEVGLRLLMQTLPRLSRER